MLVISAEVIDGALEVTAMVQGVSESDGECSLELRDATEVSTVTGTAGNGVTYCGVMRVSLADVDQDDATFQVRYVSAVTRAESAVTPVQAAP
ncbi:hypothetical protein N3K63_00600 [Microbacterium sp. W1N]|uniref:hypothetical protein n=1 Tax=Microbacterium festucae TaxID=2977531 RepID=UPI0021BEED33|nr:hypothetical protein [Microbacterium festucae]MCT9818775.1 hypothetical protein [Microbacterium festucae]